MIGTRFGHLTVLAVEEKRPFNGHRQHPRVTCQCDCGNVISVFRTNLQQGTSTQCCECSYRSRRLGGDGRPPTHGESKTRLYRIWAAMWTRCTNSKHKGYKDYGGRGISVCKAWESYPQFSDWARSHGYDDRLSIDRKNNDLGYTPDNCRWATVKQQRNNRRQKGNQ